MRALIGIALVILPCLGHASAQDGSVAPGSIRGDKFTKGSNGELAVLPGMLTVIPGLSSKETELYARGAFAIDGLTPGTSHIEANAPGSYRTFALEVGAGISSAIVEKNVAAVSSTTSMQRTRLRAVHSAPSREMPHHA